MHEYQVEAALAKQAIDSAQSILLVSHLNPDGDTLGASLAWYSYLTSIGKDCTIFCVDPVPPSVTFLEHSHKVQTDPSLLERDYDLVIANDVGSIDRFGFPFELIKKDGTTVLNVDHHFSNPRYGDINMVIEEASSTTEIITRLFKHWNVTITETLADALLNGIVTDTDNMINPATSYSSYAVASELIKAGANLHDIVNRTMRNKSIGHLKLWGLALSRLKYNPKYNIVMTYITHDDISELGVDEEAAEGIPNYLTLIPDTSLILVLKITRDGIVKGSFRTIHDHINVSHLAEHLGGGGHTKASGFRILGTLRVEESDWTIH